MKLVIRLFIFLSFLSGNLLADTLIVKPGLIHVKENFKGILRVTNTWYFKNGDSLVYAKRDYDDSKWMLANSNLEEQDIQKTGFKGVAWFRMHFKIDSAFADIPLIISVEQMGASQIFFNDSLVEEIGSFGPENYTRNNGDESPISIIPKPGVDNVISVRYRNLDYEHSYNSGGEIVAGFRMELVDPVLYVDSVKYTTIAASYYGLAPSSFFLCIGMIHFFLYIFYRQRKTNLLFTILCIVLSYYFLNFFLSFSVVQDPEISALNALVIVLSTPFFAVVLLSVMYSLFFEKMPKQFKFFLIAAALSSICFIVKKDIGALLFIIIVVGVSFEVLRVMIFALRKKLKGARIISSGFSAFVLFVAAFIVVGIVKGGNFGIDMTTGSGEFLFLLLLIAVISIPLSMSIFLAWDFAGTNKTLSKKLIEVEQLSVRTLEQEKEKQKILANQNEVLEHQVEERTKEINEQKKVIEEKNKDITDSINYAQRIQRSILPTDGEIKDIFKDSFVLFKPRDIVSGDFYQFKKRDDLKYAILADCTGHGVPGALMSMIGSNLLKQIILERGVKEPNVVLSELHKEVRSTLRQGTGVQSHDGMDAAIVMMEGKKLFIASANRPVYVVKKGELTELKPDKRSIGGSSVGDDVTFTMNELDVEPGMMVYLFSDGYADQFGGDQGKKFKVKNLGELLISISGKPLETQKEILNTTFDNWKKQLEQVDDVSLIGLKF